MARKTGRPTKCTPKKIKQVCGYIEEGLYADDAAALSGIDESTFYRWKQWGSEGRQPYETFCKALKVAEAAGQQRLLKMATPGNQGWQAQMTILERRWRAKWGRVKVEAHTRVPDARAEELLGLKSNADALLGVDVEEIVDVEPTDDIAEPEVE